MLPLTPEFDPPRGQPGHGRVQFSDRVSASASVGKELTRRALEVPWHFKLEPLARNDDEELVEELGFDGEVRPTRRLGKDPQSATQGEDGDALGSGIGVVPPPARVLFAAGFPRDGQLPFVPLWMLRSLRASRTTSCS